MVKTTNQISLCCQCNSMCVLLLLSCSMDPNIPKVQLATYCWNPKHFLRYLDPHRADCGFLWRCLSILFIVCVVFRVFAADGVMARHCAAARTKGAFRGSCWKVDESQWHPFAVLLNMACWEIHKLYTYSPYSVYLLYNYNWCNRININLSMFVRYVWAFRTRVLKTRVPERAFWANPFFQWYKVNLFPGLNRETFFPTKKKDVELLCGAQNGRCSHQKADQRSGPWLGPWWDMFGLIIKWISG